MTDGAVPAPAAGWYPDPYGSGAARFWDGTRWTEHLAPPTVVPQPGVYATQARRPLPAETPVYTVWIWLVAALPLLTSILLFLLQPQSLFREVPGSSTLHIDPFAPLGGPMYFVVMGLNYLIAAALIVLSWLDYRELVRRGVERPFHWAWSFLGIVYPIGRSIIVRGVAGGRGLAPMWVAIAVYVLGLVLATIWAITLVAQIIGTAPLNVPTGA